MKKTYGFLLIFLSLFIFIKANADDSSPNLDFQARTDKVVCVSVADPDDMPSGYFLLFDYSSKMGKQLGRPWSVVEKGKCYDIRDGGTLYVIKGTDADKIKFQNYKLYTPEQNITETGYDTKSNEPLFSDNAIAQILPSYNYSGNGDPLDHYLGTFNVQYIIPTVYSFGEGITYSSSSYPNKEFFDFMVKTGNYSKKEISSYQTRLSIVNDPRYSKQISDLYIDFAKRLTSALNSCDNRARIEYQANLQTKTIHQIWKLKDDTEINPAVDEYSYENQTGFISQIGCKDAYKNYIEQNKNTLTTIDTLALAILKDNNIKSVDEIIDINKDKAYIDGYIAGTYIPEKMSSEQITDSEKLYSFPDYIKIEPKDTQKITTSIEPTVLEEPTTDKKTEQVQNSDNNLFKLYKILPFVGIIVVLAIVITKRKNNVIRK